MDDFNFWWYIIAAVIYFLTRGKKKKQQPKNRPESENKPPKSQPKSFEELLKEITDGRLGEEEPEPTIQQEPLVIKEEKKEREESIRLEGEKRTFADDESRRVYEESIKMAEGADIAFEPNEHFKEPKLFKGSKSEEEKEWTIADEIRDGLDSNEAKKAIIYSEILSRRY